jgi:long-chain acyl-CoA synthetase
LSNLIDGLLNNLERYSHKQLICKHQGQYQGTSYGELSQQVKGLMAQLSEQGVSKGTVVGIAADNSLQWIRYDLALNQLGAICVAIPQALFIDQQKVLINRFELSLLLLSQTNSDLYQGDKRHVINIERDLIEQVFDCREITKSTLGFVDDEVSVTFSSGSSGNIKALVISKNGASEQIKAYQDMFDASEGRLIVYMPFTSYQQRLYVYGAIAFGFDLVLVPPYLLFEALQVTSPTILMGPPIMFENLALQMAKADSATIKATLGGKIEIMTTGMAKVQQATLAFFNDHGLLLCEGYGLGECGSVCVNNKTAMVLGSVGKPLPGTKVTIADDGEIVIEKGAPLLSRYLFTVDGDQTDNEDTRLINGRFYSGDLGKVDEAGFVYITGRKKTTLILKDGRKFQPEPYEKMLEQHLGLKRCALFLADDGGSFAWVVEPHQLPHPDSQQLEQKIIQWFGQQTDYTYGIKQVVVSDIEFTAQNQLLTRNLKLNRRFINEQLLTVQPQSAEMT